jgi:hypothetical protein
VQTCIRELPSFDTFTYRKLHSKLKIYLISLDNRKELEGKVIPFVRSRNPKPEVLLLDETDYNKWIDLVSSDWGGAIPATLIFSPATGNRRIIEGETTFSELQQLIRDISEKN